MAGPSPQLVSRLNELVKVIRRRMGHTDTYATVQAPLVPNQPITLRLQKEGTLVTVPLEGSTLDQFERAGIEGPLIIELKQAFMRVEKTAERRGKVFEPRARGKPKDRKKSLL